MQRALSFDDSPPLGGPMRFFLTAPGFAALAAILLLWQGEAALVSRWTGATLALTHLLTLGFLALTMVGALLQMLPIVAGVPVRRAPVISAAVWICLGSGTGLLALGFLNSASLLFQAAAVLLGAGFLLLIGAALPGLLRAGPSGAAATVGGMRLALIALGITTALGLSLASVFGWDTALPVLKLTDLHAAWGLLGWVGLLLVGVAFQVIPMFQATPTYPALVERWLVSAIAILLLIWSLLSAAEWPLRAWVFTALMAAFALFGGWTVYLLHKRKRPKADATTLFWRLSMACLLGAAGAALWPGDHALAVGVLSLVGCAMSAVSGMLYKIVPFLFWYHLQSATGVSGVKIPNLKVLLPDRHAERQFWSHLAAVLVLAGAAFKPDLLARTAAMLLVLSSCWLWANLLGAGWRYRRCAKQLESAGISP